LIVICIQINSQKRRHPVFALVDGVIGLFIGLAGLTIATDLVYIYRSILESAILLVAALGLLEVV